jgi:hypothetical protein
LEKTWNYTQQYPHGQIIASIIGTQTQKGGVNVFALANDEQHQVKYCIIDETLFKHDFWAFHPMENSATVEVSDYYDISSCYILRPWSFSIWEKITQYLDAKFKSNETENAYFPMFDSKGKL